MKHKVIILKNHLFPTTVLHITIISVLEVFYTSHVCVVEMYPSVLLDISPNSVACDGSLKSATTGVFIPQKSSNATNKSLFSGELLVKHLAAHAASIYISLCL